MYMNARRADEIAGAVFLIGFGLLFLIGFWPGILFVGAGTAIARGIARGRGWQAFRDSSWTIGLGVWVLLDYSVGALFVAIGLSTLVTALARPSLYAAKPYVDHSMD